MSQQQFNTLILLRVMAGVLALLAFALVGFRLYGFSQITTPLTAQALMHSLQILFPLTLGLFVGYLAFKGKLPFTSEDPKNKSDHE